jgi:nicotinamide riboside transporter PnuC
METFKIYIPEDFYSIWVMAIVVVIAIWLVMFVVRKLIGVALVSALIIGGLMVWQNPAVLRSAQDTAAHYYDQWRYGATADEDQRRG